MKSQTNPRADQQAKPKSESIISHRFDNGDMLEALFAPRLEKTMLAHWNGKAFKLVGQFEARPGQCFIPIPAASALLKHGVIRLPAYVEEAGSIQDLLQDIKTFIHAYVDLEKGFEVVAAHYVLLTWVYDRFRKFPILG